MTTLALTGVPPPRVDPLAAISSGAAAPAAVPAGFQLIRSNTPLAVPLEGGSGGAPVSVTVALPPGYHLTAGAGSNYYTQVRAPRRLWE